MSKWDWGLPEWRDYYDKLAKRAEQNYQSSGTARYDRDILDSMYEVVA
jgi:hypothetical protein